MIDSFHTRNNRKKPDAFLLHLPITGSDPPFFIYCISLIDYCNCISLIEFHLLINRKFLTKEVAVTRPGQLF
jgi:hypothetical protein